MKDAHRASLIFAGIGAILAPAGPAGAQIVLSQPSFEAGRNYAAFFKVEKGCQGSPTTALSVQIPYGVIVLDTPEKPGWTVSAVVQVPGGAHPSYAQGYYKRDNTFYKKWDLISRERDSFRAWIDEYVLKKGPDAFAVHAKKAA